jgi:hypothetical protein
MTAPKKVIGQILRKYNLDDGGKHITELKKGKSA